MHRKGLIGMLLCAGLGCGLGVWVGRKLSIEKKPINKKSSIISPIRFEVGFRLLDKWVKLKNEGKSLLPYFKDNEIASVAIYGMGALGERLYEELRQTEIRVAYGIDRIADKKRVEGMQIIGLQEELQHVDVIVVTPVQDFYSIEEMLEQKTSAEIISLEEVLDYCS